MKRLFFALLSFILINTSQVKATHLLGGEITWECLTSGPNAGKIVFTVKLYRACYIGAAGLGTTASISNPLYAQYGGVSSITCVQTNVLDLSPTCYNPSQQLSCGLPQASGGNQAMEEHVYVSAPVQINGIPAVTGSDFTWSSCCRPTTLNIGLQVGYFLRATMFPYTDPATNIVLSNGSTAGGASCYDSSPKFAERPATVICSGYPFTYNHNATDSDLDSLKYEWTLPMQTATNPIVWLPGYSTMSQLPGTFHSNLNVPATMNPLTGEISFTTIVTPGAGYHSTAVKVTSFKCRQKVAEIIRDIPVIIVSCPPTPSIPPLANTPPAVVFKWSANAPTSIPAPPSAIVMAGDSVNFYITSTDIQFLPGFVPQTNYLLPSGTQFGTNFADTLNGCKYPPCATLQHNGFYNATNNWWQGNFGVATRFSWKTHCNHLAQVNACFTKSNTYNFIFKVLDNWCPAPGMNFKTFAVTVIAPPAIPAPELKCAKVMGNGDVLLRWNKPITKAQDTLNSFRRYLILRSDSINAVGAYDTLQSIYNINTLQYLDVGANIFTRGRYYVIVGISSCNDQGVTIWSDTLAGMRLNAVVHNSGNSVALNWDDFNPKNNWGSKTTNEYYVWQILNGDTTIIDTTTVSWDSLEINLCYPSTVQYMITVNDTTLGWGCTSVSTISGGQVGDNLAPLPVILDEVSYDLNNDIVLSWQASSPDIGTYYIYKGATQIATVPGGVTTFTYTPTATDPCVIDFSIQAIDTCGNLNQAGIAQSSMCLGIDDVVRCDTNKKVIFSWNNYNPSWAGGSAYNLIYRSTNNGPYVFIDSVPGVVSTYSDVTINQNTYYRYRMVSQEAGSNRSASSSWDSVSVGAFIKGSIMDPPDLVCISWLNDSTLRLQWERPGIGDTNLNGYNIYHSTTNAAGSFTLIDSIRGSRTSDHLVWWNNILQYDHVGVSDSGSHYYYMTSSSGCDGQQESIASRKLRAIEFDVTAVSDSTNTLQWTPVSSTALSPNYAVWRGTNNIDNPPYGTENSEDTWAVCNEKVTYRIDYPGGSPSGCVSSSQEKDGYFVDDTPPAKQFVDSVSMRRDTTFTGMVGWKANPSKDVTKYYVMNCLPGSYKILDTVNASSGLFFVDNANAPLGKITQYTVTAQDSCGNNNLSKQNFDCHATMFVKPVMDYCDQSILLQWNAYEDFASGTGVEYVIYVSENGNTYREVGTSTEPRFKYSELVNGNNYCFYVQGWEDNGVGPISSSSAVVCLDADFIRKPAFAYMRYASVVDTNLTRMCMKIDLEGDIGEYWVKRSNKVDGGYKVIATVELPDPLTPADSNFCFDDIDVNTTKMSYYYKIDVVDPCGEVGKSSNIGRTILLNVLADNEKNRNFLTWNHYQEWAGGVMEYEVWRGTSVSNIVKIASLPLSQAGSIDGMTVNSEGIQYIDDVSGNSNIQGNGEFCYFVVAKEGSGTFMQIEPEISKSNIVCAVQSPLFYVPNSFTPNGDGINDYFMPKGAFHDVKAYSLEVFNRWGEKIYSTDNYSAKGWDGTYKGVNAPSGSYVYIVRYTSADGQDYEQRGTVSINR